MASFQQVLLQGDFDRFATLTRDDNPIHCDPDFAARSHFGGTVAGGYVEAGEPVYYGGEPWVHTDVVVVGGGAWYGDHRDHAYVHPDSRRAPVHSAPRQSNSRPKQDDHHK